MILVTGTVQTRPDSIAEASRLALEHVHRSRAEPGCISHDVHLHAEDPLRLVFVERWADMAALQAHFRVPESRGFAKALGGLATTPPSMQIYTADEITP